MTRFAHIESAVLPVLPGVDGTGKTHALCAVAQELIRAQERRVYFSPCSLLVQELLGAKRDLKLSRLLKRLSKFDVLFIDDIGYVQQSREEMKVLFTLLAERYERGRVMLTSNLPFSKWEAIFKDPMPITRLLKSRCNENLQVSPPVKVRFVERVRYSHEACRRYPFIIGEKTGARASFPRCAPRIKVAVMWGRRPTPVVIALANPLR